jgi:hypothetical protein
MVLLWVVVIAVLLAWAKYRLDRAAYRLCWYLALSTMIVIGLVL